MPQFQLQPWHHSSECTRSDLPLASLAFLKCCWSGMKALGKIDQYYWIFTVYFYNWCGRILEKLFFKWNNHGLRVSRLRIKIFQFLRLTAEIYGCFTAFNPIKTLRFAFVGKNFIWREQLRTPKYCTQSKRNLEKGGISILTKEKACLIRKGLTMEL